MIDNFKYLIFKICKGFIGLKLQTYYILQNFKTSWVMGFSSFGRWLFTLVFWNKVNHVDEVGFSQRTFNYLHFAIYNQIHGWLFETYIIDKRVARTQSFIVIISLPFIQWCHKEQFTLKRFKKKSLQMFKVVLQMPQLTLKTHKC